MSWIVRMATSLLMRKSATAASSAFAQHQPTPSRKASAARRPAGIICWSPDLMARVADRMSGQRDVTGDGFRLAYGQIRGEPTIALRAEPSPPGPKQIRALWEGHRPRLAVLLGVATSSQVPAGDLVLATSVRDATGQLKLDVRTPPLPGVHVGMVADGLDDITNDKLAGERAIAHCTGLAALLRECRQLELPTLVVLRIAVAEDMRLRETSANLARQTGRWIGKLTKRKGGVGRWWNEQTAENDATERQIDLAMRFIVA